MLGIPVKLRVAQVSPLLRDLGIMSRRAFMKLKLDRIISLATLVAAVVAIVLVLKKPAQIAQPQAPTVIVREAAPDQKPADPQPQGSPSPTYVSSPAYTPSPVSSPAPVVSTTPAAAKAAPAAGSNEVSSALAKMLGSMGGAMNLSPDSNVGSSMPNIKDQQVTMDGDIVHGRFLTEIAGKDVWVSISGHMGEKDGYATFDPTEIKVGDMDVPVSLVNPALQKKLAEEHDRLKIPTSGAQ